MAKPWQVGDKIQNRWEIHKILGGPGKSGMGIIYVVYDHELRAPLAAKTFQDRFLESSAARERFVQEARAWINLDIHQNITQAHFVMNIEGKPFLFLEFVSGGDLRQWLGTQRLTKNLVQVLRFAIQFCDGMIYALGKGIIVHRDIKPENCLITDQNTLKVSDFGLAKVFDETADSHTKGGGILKIFGLKADLSYTGEGMGTPPYMAPEQFDNAKHVDVRADIYAFGVMLYEMIEGKLPFVGNTRQDYEHLHKTKAPPRLQLQNLPLQTLVETCIAKDPARRFADFGIVRQQLKEIYEELTGEPAPQPAKGKALTAFQWTNKGVSLGNLGRNNEALSCHDQALKLNPQDARAWSNKGSSLWDLNRKDEALQCFEKALILQPNDEKLWFNKGRTLGEAGKHKEAIKCFDKALSLNELFDAAWSGKATALDATGHPKEALACFDRALDLNPHDAKTWYGKGHTLDNLKQLDAALTCYDKALELDPNFVQAWNNKGLALSSIRNRREEAVACFDRAIALDPRHANAWMNKGATLAELSRFQDALACFEAAARLGHPQAAQGIAQCKQMLAMFDSPASNHPLAYRWEAKDAFRRGVTLMNSRQWQQALEQFERAIALDPELEQAWAAKAQALFGMGRMKEAIACYDRALKLNPHSAEDWYNKGTTLGEMKQYKEAIVCFDKAIENNSRFPQAWFNKGVALAYGLRRYAEAVACFEKAQQLGHPQAAQMIAQFRRLAGK